MADLKQGKIAVIGTSVNIQVFKAFGVEVHQVASVEEGRGRLQKIFDAGARPLIFVLGRLGQELEKEITLINRTFGYNVLVLPDEASGWGLGPAALAEKVKKAIGFKLQEFEKDT